ncbi:MAG: DISARM system SNF2-like helicase DrmD [Anaerolineae bacterium]|nr:DISARM system SNF2-like helicase DrmD [Anaerolineae bacterium]
MQLPEQGQIVSVRRRMYTVTEVRPSSIASPTVELPMNLITLASVEDDALGESIQVLWETEVNAQIIERAELPSLSGFDTPERLDTFLDAVRWGSASQADRAALQAPFRSGIQLQDYQLNPLVRAVQMPRVSLLIADDVGLGKTVETGLIIQELISRNRARSAVIICPAGLQLHWRDQMRDKFGLEFRIIDSESMRQLRRTRGIHVNPWTHFPRLITSMDFIKRDRPLLQFLNSLQDKPRYPRPFDILVIDEAHNVAPSGRGNYALDSQRTTAIREIVPYFEHHLFLSATPHNGFPESFSALLELLDNQRFARGITPDPRQLEAVMVRRLKRDLRDRFDQPIFAERRIEPIEVSYSGEERQIHRWLNEYAQLRRSHARSDEERYASEFVLKLLKKRLLSSPEAFRKTLERHKESITRPRSTNETDVPSSVGVLRRQIAITEEDYANDEDIESANDSAVVAATRTVSPPTDEEKRLLDHMLAAAKLASERRDSKTLRLIEWLKQVVKPDGVWNDERVILFTEYRATQQWLQQVLFSAGLGDADRLRLIYGGMDGDEREAIKAAFQAAPSTENRVRILLATDAASEGIDLQNYCHRLVHIEIPWNPNRLEQRNGRIDRMGQKHAPLIYHFVPRGYERTVDSLSSGVSMNELEGDLEFLMRAVEKVEQMREDLMGKVGDVIAAQVEEAMLGFRRRLDLASVEEKTRPARMLLKLERELDTRIQKQIQAFYDQRHVLRLTPEHVQKVVEVALDIAGQPALQPAAGKPGAFFIPSMKGTWQAAKNGLAHPFTQEERPVVFDERLAGDDSVVLAHLNHPLVLLAQRLLRAEVWSPQGSLHRVTARIVPNHALNAPAVVAYARLVVVGGGRYRLHEELITAGGILTYGERPSFRRMSVGDLNTALDAAEACLPGERTLESLTHHWDVFAPSLRSALDVRMSERIETITKQLADRGKNEAEDVRAVLMELETSIRRELNAPEAVQKFLPGFAPSEREQYERDLNALRARLERIPDEIEHEQQAVMARYSDLQPRLFPVAVMFLIPASMDR